MATSTTRPLTPALAAAPVLLLAVLLALSVALFGADSSYGANQVALLFSTGAAALVAARLGLGWKAVERGIVRGVALCIGPMLILLSVGMLIGAWILCGTIPALIYYGVQVLSPGIFYAASALTCAIVAISIGSSWTVAGTMGIGLMAIAASFNLSPAIAAGAIVSGAYFGDKMSPLSDTTNLAAGAASVDLFEHIRHMLWTTVPGMLIALALFALLGFGATAPPAQVELQVADLRSSLEGQFNLGPHLFIPLLIMLGLAWRKVPALPAIMLSTLVGIAFALAFQPEAVLALAEEAGSNAAQAAAESASVIAPEPAIDTTSTIAATLAAALAEAGTFANTAFSLLQGVWISLFAGFTSVSDNPFMDKLLSKGGLGSMLNTVSLILCALAFGGALEETGILRYLVALSLRRVRTQSALVSTTVGVSAATNMVAGDHFIAIAIPGTMFRDEYERRGLSRLNLSRTLEDSATLTSALVPWNTCGAYMSATLGIATLSYAPYAFFNYLCPLIAILYAHRRIAQKPLEQV